MNWHQRQPNRQVMLHFKVVSPGIVDVLQHTLVVRVMLGLRSSTCRAAAPGTFGYQVRAGESATRNTRP